MRADDLNITELIDIDPQRGEARCAGSRVLLLDVVAMGLLRRQLIETWGAAAARAVLTRFAFAHGWRMAEAMRAEVHFECAEEWSQAGGRMAMLQGLLRLAPDSDPLSPAGARVEASYEAEQHLLHFGPADAPVCWTLAGCASGYLSRTQGKAIYVLERRCIAQGDAACQFMARPAEDWGAELEPHLPFFGSSLGPSFGPGELDATLRGAAAPLVHTGRPLGERDRAPLVRHRQDVRAPDLVAHSPAMQRVRDLALRAARVDATVLITGESGTGKERVASLVHEASTRAQGPWLAINCGAIPEHLLESELFGHARGAFTGATHDRVGLFEAAGGGTLLLDEIGELPPGMQVKLLRVLQERKVRRVGENHGRPIDIRILAATHRDLAADVASGRFRQDLYYRLKVIELCVPPLRERGEDLLPLAHELLAEAARRAARPALRMSPQAEHALLGYAWPGNVRELENALERAAALAPGRCIERDDLPDEVWQRPLAPPLATGIRPLEEIEREYILAALARNHGHQTRTAAELGIGVSTLYRKLKKATSQAARPSPQRSARRLAQRG
jgi:DNA-binding NtrC family response regulator/predicted hydrocarbon binding protein